MLAPKLIVSVTTISKDLESGETTIIVPDKEPMQIIKSGNDAVNEWDGAHITRETKPEVVFAEPDIDVAGPFYAHEQEIEERGEPVKEAYYQFIEDWPHPDEPGIWHLGDGYTQLKTARDEVAKLTTKRTVRIAHLDTGYDEEHLSIPQHPIIRHDLERNFVDGEEDKWNNAEDPFTSGMLKQPGHGTGTLSLLAGTQMKLPYCTFDDFFGLHDSIEIVPIRIAKSVVLFRAGAFVKALNYIINELYPDDSKRVHIVTMSMGGLASKAWADMVNLAYDRGIFIVSAAGNNFNKLPARTLVFPARFNRVVAACGVTYDRSPYAKPQGEGSFHIMEGNYGPQALMGAAIAAFTPNVPWATFRFHDTVGIRGDGTSSATPQIAAAAALYYIKNYDALEALPEPWMRVEAIRKALFTSAQQTITGRDEGYEVYYGNGILQAADMLKIPVAAPNELNKQQKDKIFFPFLKLIFGLKAADETLSPEEEMLETELMQMVQSDEALQRLLQDEEKKVEELTPEEQVQLAKIVVRNERASETLKMQMQLLLNRAAL